jgi:hypothetical protein
MRDPIHLAFNLKYNLALPHEDQVMPTTRRLLVACLMCMMVPASHAWTEAQINAGKKDLQERFFGANQTLVIASRKTREGVVTFSLDFLRKNNLSPEDLFFDVYESDNGWYAVTLGVEPAQACQDRKRKLVGQGMISKDSYCTNGARFHGAYQLYGDDFEHVGGTALN